MSVWTWHACSCFCAFADAFPPAWSASSCVFGHTSFLLLGPHCVPWQIPVLVPLFSCWSHFSSLCVSCSFPLSSSSLGCKCFESAVYFRLCILSIWLSAKISIYWIINQQISDTWLYSSVLPVLPPLPIHSRNFTLSKTHSVPSTLAVAWILHQGEIGGLFFSLILVSYQADLFVDPVIYLEALGLGLQPGLWITVDSLPQGRCFVSYMEGVWSRDWKLATRYYENMRREKHPSLSLCRSLSL